MEIKASRWDVYAALRNAGKGHKEARELVDRIFADKDEIVICVEGVKDAVGK